MDGYAKYKLLAFFLILASLPSLACLITTSEGTAIPVGRSTDFEVQTATPTLKRPPTAETSTTTEEEAELVLPLGDAPTNTPDPDVPTPTATLVVQPTETVTTTEIATTTLATAESSAALPLTSTVSLTQTEAATATATTIAPAQPTSPPAPPLTGGDWDFEADFVPWPNPYGEPCPGASVASGWTAFVQEGEYGSSCMNENLYQPNVFSGAKSQEITFDFITANSGIYRTIPTQVGHRYNIMAYAKHDRSISVVEMALGVDMTGGTVWNAETVTWFPWDEDAEDTWLATEETVTATGETLTLFIKGFHPLAEQGGKTVIDKVSVTDLGP